MQAADAEDVAQDVLLRVARRMPAFAYDRGLNFSGWLKRVWHDAWIDHLRSRGRPGAQGSGDSETQLRLAEVEGDDLASELRAELEREVLQEALARARRLVSPRDWQVFQAVARQHDLTPSNVGVIKHRAQQLVKGEAAGLEGRR